MLVKMKSNKNSQTDGVVNWLGHSGKLLGSITKAEHTYTQSLSNPAAESAAYRNAYICSPNYF